VKINQENFIDYEYYADEWYHVDVLIDWDSQQITLYINNEQQSPGRNGMYETLPLTEY
jgi:hypothetical protein